jgi:hypothetical protein
VEIAVRHYLYRPDGTNKHLRTEAVDGISDNQRHLVQALVDKYNEDNNLFQVYSSVPLSSLYALHSLIRSFIHNS